MNRNEYLFVLKISTIFGKQRKKLFLAENKHNFCSKWEFSMYIYIRLGEYEVEGELNGRKYYKQRDTEGNRSMFLYHANQMWWVDEFLGRTNDAPKEGDFWEEKGNFVMLMNRRDTEEPPEEGGWILFGDGERDPSKVTGNFKETWKLINDGTLTAKKTSLDAEQGPFGMCRILGVYEDQKWEGGKETSDAWKKQQRAMGRYL